MHFMEGVRVALKALLANELRTFLTLLAYMVGVTSVMTVVSIIKGLNIYIADARGREKPDGSNHGITTLYAVSYRAAV